MQSAVIIGATSGIGRELAKILSENNYVVGIAGRRTHLLSELQKELPNKSVIKYIDVSSPGDAMSQLKELFSEIGGVDLCIISSGVGFISPDLQWSLEKEVIDVNVSGFAAMANVAMNHFFQRGSGHLVAISSVAAIRGDGDSPSYNASKAFISNYMEGLRKRARKLNLPIVVTDIKPGFVATAMAKGDGLFWVAPLPKAAQQIFNVIKRKKSHAYITKRWRLIGWLLKVIPDFIYDRI
ncbi:MAG: SDR family NAD(P)-dependent oxidoreductase [Nitrospirae bacterium]|nr:SDR family NAD(P)-dependent oxidoreductase [Nitrospirota bacterium]